MAAIVPPVSELFKVPEYQRVGELAAEIIRVGMRNAPAEHDASYEVTFFMAMAKALGHAAATIDLREGREIFKDRMDAFVAVVEETYHASMRQRAPLVDASGRRQRAVRSP